jgi:hypothetical protein
MAQSEIDFEAGQQSVDDMAVLYREFEDRWTAMERVHGERQS